MDLHLHHQTLRKTWRDTKILSPIFGFGTPPKTEVYHLKLTKWTYVNTPPTFRGTACGAWEEYNNNSSQATRGTVGSRVCLGHGDLGDMEMSDYDRRVQLLTDPRRGLLAESSRGRGSHQY